MFLPMSWMSPFDGGQHDGPPVLPLARLAGQALPDDLEGGLGRPCRLDQLGQEHLSRLEGRPYSVQGGDEDVVHHVQGGPTLQQGPGGLPRLPLQAGLHDLLQAPLFPRCGGGGHPGRAGDRGGDGGVPVSGDEFPGVGVDVHQQVVAPHCRHHGVYIGVEDGQVQSPGHGHGEEVLVHQGPGGQAEGDVGHPKHGL